MRLGFFEPARAHAILAELGEVAKPLVAPDRAQCRSRSGARLAGRHRRRRRGPRRSCSRRWRTTRARRCACSRCSGRARRWGSTCAAIPSSGTSSPIPRSGRPALRRTSCAPDCCGPWAPTPATSSRWRRWSTHAAEDALRVEYRRLLLRLASRDLTHHLGVDDVAAELADLAAGTLDAALAVARAKVGEAANSCRLAVIAMGKCGGHELNYVSDVDVIFVAEPVEGVAPSGDAAMRAATQLASTMMQVCSDHTGEGTIWPVDANLRPEGKSGPLVRHARQPPRLLRAVGQDVGVPGAAQGPTGRRRHGAGSGVRRADRPAGVVGGRARRVRRGGPGDASPGDRPHPGRHGRAPAQARFGRSARRRVRRPAAPDGARPGRRGGARRPRR